MLLSQHLIGTFNENAECRTWCEPTCRILYSVWYRIWCPWTFRVAGLLELGASERLNNIVSHPTHTSRPFCHWKFFKPDHLRRHLRSHTKEKPFCRRNLWSQVNTIYRNEAIEEVYTVYGTRLPHRSESATIARVHRLRATKKRTQSRKSSLRDLIMPTR